MCFLATDESCLLSSLWVKACSDFKVLCFPNSYVPTWDIFVVKVNGYDIQSSLTNLRSSVADDVEQVILTSNEVAASQKCTVKCNVSQK